MVRYVTHRTGEVDEAEAFSEGLLRGAALSERVGPGLILVLWVLVRPHAHLWFGESIFGSQCRRMMPGRREGRRAGGRARETEHKTVRLARMGDKGEAEREQLR